MTCEHLCRELSFVLFHVGGPDSRLQGVVLGIVLCRRAWFTVGGTTSYFFLGMGFIAVAERKQTTKLLTSLGRLFINILG